MQTAASNQPINIVMTAKGDGYWAVENAGGGKSVETFHFLGKCRKAGVTQTVSFGDHGYGMNGRNAIKGEQLVSFIELAKAEGLRAATRREAEVEASL